MPFAIKKLVQAQYADLPVEQILVLPVQAIKGISQSDADHLNQAFGIQTVSDLGTNPYFHAAYSLVRVGLQPGFDAGPTLDWEQILADAPIDFYVNHPSGRFRIDYGPVFYRGRLDNTARLLVIGQDPSTDEILAQRAFVGRSGQRLQKFLNKVGINRSYTIINTFVFSIYHQFDNEMQAISLEAPILDFRKRLFDTIVSKNPIEAVITFGNGPRHAVEHWPNVTGLPVFNLVHPAAPEATAFPSWNQQLQPIVDAITPDDPDLIDITPYSGVWINPAHEAPVPRYDLPFGIPEWHGRNGTRSNRDGDKKIIWEAI